MTNLWISQEINESFFTPHSAWRGTRVLSLVPQTAKGFDALRDWFCVMMGSWTGVSFSNWLTRYSQSTHTPSPRQPIDLQRRAEVASARIHGNKRSLLHKKTFAIFSNIITRNGRRIRRRRRFFFFCSYYYYYANISVGWRKMSGNVVVVKQLLVLFKEAMKLLYKERGHLLAYSQGLFCPPKVVKLRPKWPRNLGN